MSVDGYFITLILDFSGFHLPCPFMRLAVLTGEYFPALGLKIHVVWYNGNLGASNSFNLCPVLLIGH